MKQRNTYARTPQKRQTLQQKPVTRREIISKPLPVLSVPNVPRKKYDSDPVAMFPGDLHTKVLNFMGHYVVVFSAHGKVRRTLNQRQKRKRKRH